MTTDTKQGVTPRHYISYRDDMGNVRIVPAPSARLAYRLWLNLPEGVRGKLVVNGKQVETDKERGNA